MLQLPWATLLGPRYILLGPPMLTPKMLLTARPAKLAHEHDIPNGIDNGPPLVPCFYLFLPLALP